VADAKRLLAEFERAGGAPDAIRLERDLILVQQGVVGEADTRLRATVDPNHADARFVLEALARGYMASERWAEAGQACQFWRGIEPDAPWAWLWGGLVAERLSHLELAGELYGRAHELAPDDRDARISVARIALRRRNPSAAAPHFEWAVARDPDDSEALLGLAQSHLDGGRIAQAVPLIERVLSRDPDSAAAAALRGRAALEAGDPPAAEPLLRRALATNSTDSESLHLLVLCLRAQRKDTEADHLGRKLEALDRDLRRLGELERKFNPRLADPGPYHEAGVIALRVGRTRQGVNYLETALRLDPEHRPTHAAVAAYFRAQGRLDLAEIHQARADKP
jgi:tetratricopeptide (TPR) repeat protein